MKNINKEAINKAVAFTNEVCAICSKEITYFLDSNNARPVADGRCCSSCNADQVIPARHKVLAEAKNW